MNTVDARFSFDHDLHIHSHLSACSSDPEQSTQRILQYAIDEGLSRICVTDHYWDSAIFCPSFWYAPQNYDHIAESLPLPKDPDVRFLFGCETEMDSDFEIGIPLSRFDDFDFVIIPTTHLHMTGHVITEKDAASLEARARLWVERLDALLDKPLPFHKIGIAHLACKLIAPSSHEDYLKTLDMIPTEEMERLFKKETGESIRTMIVRRKLEQAQNLLLTTSLSVGDIARRLGYADTVGLIHLFRRYLDCTPLEFRKRSRLSN